MKKEIEPIKNQQIDINAKTLSNSLDALLKCEELGVDRGVILFGPIEEPNNILLDETFEKVAEGMQRGSIRELVYDGSPKTASQISQNHPYYNVDKK